MFEWNIAQADKYCLHDWLELNFLIFRVQNSHAKKMIFGKYLAVVNDVHLIKFNLDGAPAGHCSVVIQNIYFSSKLFKVAFVTSVYIYPDHRRKGFLKPLMMKVDEVAKNSGCFATLVIARKAVGDMYFKQGYRGFSIFPKISVKPERNFSDSSQFKLRHIDKLTLNETYIETYKGLNGTLERSELSWNSIVDGAHHGNHEFLINNTNNKFSYIIVKGDTVIELAGDSENLCAMLENSNVSEIEITHDHPTFNSILSARPSKFTYRPEPKEGHLIKIYNDKLPIVFDLNNLLPSVCFERNIFSKESKLINILYLNQW